MGIAKRASRLTMSRAAGGKALVGEEGGDPFGVAVRGGPQGDGRRVDHGANGTGRRDGAGTFDEDEVRAPRGSNERSERAPEGPFGDHRRTTAAPAADPAASAPGPPRRRQKRRAQPGLRPSAPATPRCGPPSRVRAAAGADPRSQPPPLPRGACRARPALSPIRGPPAARSTSTVAHPTPTRSARGLPAGRARRSRSPAIRSRSSASAATVGRNSTTPLPSTISGWSRTCSAVTPRASPTRCAEARGIRRPPSGPSSAIHLSSRSGTRAPRTSNPTRSIEAPAPCRYPPRRRDVRWSRPR